MIKVFIRLYEIECECVCVCLRVVGHAYKCVFCTLALSVVQGLLTWNKLKRICVECGCV